MAEAPRRPLIASLVDQFTDEFGDIANQIVPEIRSNLDLGMPPRLAVQTALQKFHVDQRVTESILNKLVAAAAIGFGVEPTAVVDAVGVRKAFLNNHWPGDDLTLSQRIARADYRQIIIDTMDAQMRRSGNWMKLAGSLTDKKVVAGELPAYIDRLQAAARKDFADQPELKAEFVNAMKAARKRVDRLSQNGAPNQSVKAAYNEILRAAQTLDDKALDKALHQAVTEKARYNAERIARTEMARAYGAGVDLHQAKDTDVIAERIMLSTRHPKTCICDFFAKANLYGMGPGIYPKTHKPPYPFHPHCVLPGQMVHIPGRVIAATQSLYIGPCVEVRLGSGKSLSVTTNHPVLTARGWVLAKLLRETDQVVAATDPEGISLRINPDHHQGPARIEDVFRSLMESSQVASGSMPSSPEHFHGDGRFINGDIQVVYAEGLLWGDLKPEGREINGEKDFNRRAVHPAPLALDGSSGFQADGFAASAPSELRRGRGGPSAGVIAGNLLPPIALDFMKGALGDSELFKSGCQHDAADPELARQFVLRFASQVATDNIIEIRYFDFSGHVYDLQVDPWELFICQGVVVKNCLCIKTDIFEGELKLNSDMDPAAAQKFIASLPVEKQKELLGAAGQEAFAKNPKSWQKHLKSWQGVQPVKLVEGLKPEMFTGAQAAPLVPAAPPPQTLDEKVAAMETRLRPQRFESVAVFDPAGNQVLFKDGARYSVTFDSREVDQMAGNIVTHNHPRGWEHPEGDPRRGGNSFSLEDIRLATKAQVREMRAASPWYDHSIAPGENGWNYDYFKDVIAPAFQKADDEFYSESMRAIADRKITLAQAEADRYHVVWERVAKRLGLKYSRKRITE